MTLDAISLQRRRLSALRQVHEEVEAVRLAAGTLQALVSEVLVDAGPGEVSEARVAVEAFTMRLVAATFALHLAIGEVAAIVDLDSITRDDM